MGSAPAVFSNPVFRFDFDAPALMVLPPIDDVAAGGTLAGTLGVGGGVDRPASPVRPVIGPRKRRPRPFHWAAAKRENTAVGVRLPCGRAAPAPSACAPAGKMAGIFGAIERARLMNRSRAAGATVAAWLDAIGVTGTPATCRTASMKACVSTAGVTASSARVSGTCGTGGCAIVAPATPPIPGCSM